MEEMKKQEEVFIETQPIVHEHIINKDRLIADDYEFLAKQGVPYQETEDSIMFECVDGVVHRWAEIVSMDTVEDTEIVDDFIEDTIINGDEN